MRLRSSFTALLLIAAASPAFAAGEICQKFAQDATSKAMTIFHDTKMDVAGKRAELATLFAHTVDTDWIGRYVLGRYWKDASAEQQKQYLALYREYLSSSYISKFDDQDGLNVDAIKIVSITPGTEGLEAKTLIQTKGDQDVHVDYLLEESASGCTVHDIRVEGVSLLISQRSEFGNVAGQGGVARIISVLEAKLKK